MLDQQEWPRFGEYLRSLRQRKDLTLREVGKLAGVSFSDISEWERGQRKPPKRDVLERLAPVYAVTTMQLFEAAGYNVTPKSALTPERVDWAFEMVCRDPDFYNGALIRNQNLSLEVKALVIEFYQRATQLQILTKAQKAGLQNLLDVPQAVDERVVDQAFADFQQYMQSMPKQQPPVGMRDLLFAMLCKCESERDSPGLLPGAQQSAPESGESTESTPDTEPAPLVGEGLRAIQMPKKPDQTSAAVVAESAAAEEPGR